MTLFRLTRRPYASELSGKGAAKYGYRWNTPGTEIIYCAESRALALAEVMVHLSAALAPDDLCMVEIETGPQVTTAETDIQNLPEGWDAFPHRRITQEIGDRFVQENKHCLLRVPSAVVPGDFNVLINTAHHAFRHITVRQVRSFKMGRRLLGRETGGP